MNNGWLDIFLLNVTVLGEGALYGVDINTGGIADSFANFVWEPSVVKVFFCGLSMQSFLHIFAVSPLLFFFWLLEDILTSNCFCTDQCHKCCYWGCMPYFKRGRNRQEPKGNVDFVQASGHWFRPNLDILLVSSYGLIHIKSAPPLNCPAEWRLLPKTTWSSGILVSAETLLLGEVRSSSLDGGIIDVAFIGIIVRDN